MTPEARLKAKHRAYFRERGWYVFAPVQMGLGAAGLDWYACIEGRFVAIEFKAEHLEAIPTARQAATIKEITRAGGVAFTTNSLERTIDYIEQHVLGQYRPGRG